MPLPLFKHWTYHIFSPGQVARDKYESFQLLLEQDRQCHELIAELEEIYYHDKRLDLAAIEAIYDGISRSVAAMVSSLNRMAPSSYGHLQEYFKKIDTCSRFILTPPTLRLSPPYTLPLDGTGADDQKMVGGKGLNLALLKNTLALPVPSGFTITTSAFNAFLDSNNLRPAIDKLLARLSIRSFSELDRYSAELVDMVLNAPLPHSVYDAIAKGVADLARSLPPKTRFAVRSSAVAEDSSLSFAGQYRTMLNVESNEIISTYKKVVASKYEPQALSYRINFGLSDCETPMAAVVLPMIAAKASGVMFTTGPDGCSDATLTIHTVQGSGEKLVGGTCTDETTSFRKGEPDPQPLRGNTPRQILPDNAARTLCQWGLLLEDFYNDPQDVEWCLDQDDRLFLLQSRPLRISPAPQPAAQTLPQTLPLPILLEGGECAAAGIAAGKVFILKQPEQLAHIPTDTILVTATTPPDLALVIHRLRGVVAEQGSVAGHFASIAREFQVPTLTNVGNRIAALTDGLEVTVDGYHGLVYAGTPDGGLQPAPPVAADQQSPYRRKLKYLLDFVAQLRLVDPAMAEFNPAGCRSLHDIVRFTHEKGMAEMFAIGSRWSTKIKGARRLRSSLPMTIYILDVGDGLLPEALDLPEILPEHIHCHPMRTLLAGLSHPDIQWAGHTHFDWKSFDQVVMAGGMARKESDSFASYAVLGDNYLNLNLRFGYHFSILDILCSNRPQENYIQLRFAGGGGDFTGKSLRMDFLCEVLGKLGFKISQKGDLLDARLSHVDQQQLIAKIEITGILLGVTRLMDMFLKDRETAKQWAASFLRGEYRFNNQDHCRGGEE